MVNAKWLSLSLAVCASFTTAITLLLFGNIGYFKLGITSASTFISTLIISYVVLEFYVVKLISEIRKTKEQEIEDLKKLEVFRREFLADISHELKTPIFAAQGFVHTLLDGAVKDKNVRDRFLKKAAKSLDGLDNLVQDLLTISQMETGQITMKFENFNIFELVREVFEQLEDKSDKKNISTKIAGWVDPNIFVYADMRRIYQVMINLVNNAIKYIPEGGQVSVGFKKQKNLIHVTVQDNGDGISEEHTSRIFERFYRIEKSRSKGIQGGTGLGLAISKHIVEAHNSILSVSSKLGKGSTFSFDVPIGKEVSSPFFLESEFYDDLE